MHKGFAVALLLITTVVSGHAETITSAANGNWGAGATWAVISRTGTITVTSGQAVVTGSGTLFLSEVTVGSVILRSNGTTVIGTVASIADDTQLTLTANASSSYGGNYTARKVPAPADAVVIAPGTSVSQNIAATACAGITIAGTLVMNSGDVLTVSGGVGGAGTWSTGGGGTKTIQLSGDYAFSGTSTGNGALVVLNGNAGDQTLSGTISTGTGSLTVNKSSGRVILGSDIVVSGTLTLTQGNVVTNGYTLTLGSAASRLGTLSRTSGTIIGNFSRWFAAATVSNVLFPVGTAGNYRPATVSFTAAPSAAGRITTSFIESDPGAAGLPLDDAGTSIVNCAGNGYWALTATALTGGTYSLDLTAEGFGGVSVVSTLRILKRPTGGGNWTLQGVHSAGTGDITTPVAHRTGMSGFSEFGIGGASDNPLPIQLVSFSAIATGGNTVVLTWATVYETNNYGFEVQKSTEDRSYQTIPGSFQAGQGTAMKFTEYTYTDQTATAGSWFYRLKQIDLNGTAHYTEGTQVSVPTDVVEVAPRGFALMQNYPNPFNPSTTITFELPASCGARLSVYDMLGREVSVLVNETMDAGVHEVRLDGADLAGGIYFYRLQAGDFTQTRRLIVLK